MDAVPRAPELNDIVAKYPPGKPRALLHLLQDIQTAQGYLSREAIGAAAQHLGVTETRAFQIATFYKAFHLSPRSRQTLRICTGTSCHIRGAMVLADEVRKTLGAGPGATTADGAFSIELVNCVGACALAPVLLVDGEMLGNVHPGTVARRRKRAGEAP